jgi:hypothetical protein
MDDIKSEEPEQAAALFEMNPARSASGARVTYKAREAEEQIGAPASGSAIA